MEESEAMSSPSGVAHDLFRKSPLIQKLYKSRGVTDAEGTVMNLDKLLSPADLPDIETAVDRLVLALRQREDHSGWRLRCGWRDFRGDLSVLFKRDGS